MRLSLAVALTCLGLSILNMSADARDQPRACGHTPAIIATADFLLTEPATAPRFWRDRTGDDAAYLRIRYGGLSYAEGQALLASLEKRSRPLLRLLELKLAHQIRRACGPDRGAAA